MPLRPDVMYMTRQEYDDLLTWGREKPVQRQRNGRLIFTDDGGMEHDDSPLEPEELRQCAHCGTTKGVRLEDARTAYVREPPTVWDRIRAEDGGLTPTPAVGEDPNAAIYLCRPCAREHHDHWDDLWQEYYSGLL